MKTENIQQIIDIVEDAHDLQWYEGDLPEMIKGARTELDEIMGVLGRTQDALEMIARLHEDNEDECSFIRSTLLHNARDVARIYLQGGILQCRRPIKDFVEGLSEDEIEKLNPGIRHTVRTLREWGYDTRDSGDGKTKNHGCDLPCPYVHIFVDDPDTLPRNMRNLRDMLRESGVQVGPCNSSGDSPTIEGFVTSDMTAWIHLFNVVIPEHSPDQGA